MSKKELTNLINKYLQGISTKDEKDLVDAFYHRIQDQEPGWEAWSAEEKRQIKQALDARMRSRFRSQNKLFSIRRWAAVIVVLVVAGGLVYKNWPQKNQQIAVMPDLALEVVSTGKDKERTVLLSDGSYVHLSENSRLTFPKEFEGQTRKVFLTGKALFDVESDSDRPFLVQCGTVITEVLGTTFSVRARSEESEVYVSVTEGQVRVSEESQEIRVLSRDEELTYDTDTKSVVLKEPEIINHGEQPPIEFKLLEVTMEEAAGFIEKRWDYEIEFENEEIRDCKVVASFFEHDSLEDVVSILCGINNALYRLEQEKVVIYGNGCN